MRRQMRHVCRFCQPSISAEIGCDHKTLAKARRAKIMPHLMPHLDAPVSIVRMLAGFFILRVRTNGTFNYQAFKVAQMGADAIEAFSAVWVAGSADYRTQRVLGQRGGTFDGGRGGLRRS